MQLPGLLIILLASITFSAALPAGLSFSEDLKTAIAQKRTQERDLAASNSLSEEKRAYQLETSEVAAPKHKRDLDFPKEIRNPEHAERSGGGKVDRRRESLHSGS